MTPRQAALLSVNSCIKNGRYTNIELNTVIKKYKFEGLDKSFFTALFYGTVEKMLALDHVISSLSSIPVEKLDNMVLCLLRTGLYQILFMDKIPDSAACNESVELCKRYCPKSSVGFVNAVLRNACRKKDEIFEKMKKLEGHLGVSVMTSIPLEIITKWAKDYGDDIARKTAFHFSDRRPFVTLRVNTQKITRERLASALGSAASMSQIVDSAIVLSGSFPIEELFGFDGGLFFVQDEASQLASSLINRDVLPENALVVDVCACPGGKSFSAAINLGDKARIISRDLHANKLGLIDSSARRLGITNIEISAADARVCDESLVGMCDAVICDVPCSGLGVIAKKPDIRYKPLGESERLPEIQKQILTTASKYLKSGGFVVYSTCTLNRDENENVVSWFLEQNPDFALSDDMIIDGQKGMATLFPHIYGTDGFFIAKIIKK